MCGLSARLTAVNRRMSQAPAAMLAVLLALGLAVTGCSGGPASAQIPPVSARPTATPSAPSDTQMDAWLDTAWAAVISKHPSATRPEVEFVRYSTPDTWANDVAPCMQAEGFSVTVSSDGGIQSGTLPAVQAEAYDVALFKCSASYPMSPEFSSTMTTAQLDSLYDYYTGDLTECLTALGFEISPAPSRQAFQESYVSHPWLPFEEAFRQLLERGDDPAELEQKCPQMPPHV